MQRAGRVERRDAAAGLSMRTVLPLAAALLTIMAGQARGQSQAVDRPSLQIGVALDAEIDAGDRTMDAGQHSREYRLPLAAGQRIQIDMDSLEPAATPFDTYLRLLDSHGREVAANDDRGDGTYNSR